MEFLNMGEYAGYIWASYAVTALPLAVITIHAILRYRRQAASKAKKIDKAQHETQT